jgi:flagellar hook-length control protein FliK
MPSQAGAVKTAATPASGQSIPRYTMPPARTVAQPTTAPDVPALPVRSQLADLVALSHHAKSEPTTAHPDHAETTDAPATSEAPRPPATAKTFAPPTALADQAALQIQAATHKLTPHQDPTALPKDGLTNAAGSQTLLANAVTANTASRHQTEREEHPASQPPPPPAPAPAERRTPAAKASGTLTADEVPALHRSEPPPPEPTSFLRSRAEALTDTAMNMAGVNPRFEAIVQRVERLQQMVENFEQHVTSLASLQGGTMTIELTPQALGRLTVNCDIKDGAMTLELVADSANARNVLADHAQAIRDVVQSSGYTLAQLDVRTRGEWADQRPTPFRPPNDGARRERKANQEPATTGLTTPRPATVAGNHAHAVWLIA